MQWLCDDSKSVLESSKNSHKGEEEIEMDFGLEVLEISETEDEVENVEDNNDLIVIN